MVIGESPSLAGEAPQQAIRLQKDAANCGVHAIAGGNGEGWKAR